jgi:hypothetical protein
MRKRFTKSILVGTVAVVVSAIVAGPAFGRFVPNSGSAPTQHAQQSKAVVAYEYPNLRRVENLLTPAERRQLGAVAAAGRNINVRGRQQLDAAVPANTTATVSSSGSGFSWRDAGVGLGVGLAIVAGLGLVALVGTRRKKATPIPA